MIVLGLTGGIGTGKSTAAKYLVDKGFAHIDADKIGWEITKKGSPLLKILDEKFGPLGEYGDGVHEVLTDEGELNRKTMATVVFSNDERTARFNDIMLEIIVEEVKNRINCFQSTDGYTGILLDAPLLFEAGADKLCDKVLLITADLDTRIKRVCMRDGVSSEDVMKRINAQMSDDEKGKHSDFVISNSTGIDELHEKLNGVIDKINIDKI